MNTRLILVAVLVTFFVSGAFSAGAVEQEGDDFKDKFRQLDEVLPTPND